MGENHQHLVDQHTTQTQVEDKSRYATTTTTTLHQSKHKYKYTMKITGLIASTLMLLLVVMTSTASALSIERPPSCEFETRLGDSILVEELMHGDIKDNKCCWFGQLEHKSKCYQNTPKPCCRAFTLECEACAAGVSEEEFCRWKPQSPVCPQKPDNKPSHPDNCYSTIWNTEIMHGEIGARKRCWYGKWEKKSKCEKNPPITHPNNCYSKIWNTEIMHGEMGAKKGCWYGKWERKSKCEKKTSHPDNCYSTIWNTEIMHGEMGARSAAGTETGSASLSAMVVTRMTNFPVAVTSFLLLNSNLNSIRKHM